MPRCTGCGNEAPASARFCPLCGKAVGPTAAAPASVVPASYGAGVPAPGNNGAAKIAIASLVGLLAVGAATFALVKASGVLGAKQTQIPASGVLTAPAVQTVQAPVLNAPQVKAPSVPNVTAPVLQAPTVAGNPMPADVIAYLRWLKQFEAARRDLQNRSEAQAIVALTEGQKHQLEGLMKEPDEQKQGDTASKESAKNIASINQEWNNAASIFRQKMPPDACASLATSYNTMFGTVVSQMGQILQIALSISSPSQNPNQSNNMQQMLQKLIGEANNKGMSHSADAAFADANNALNAVRNQYTSMPADIDSAHFDIKTESNVAVQSVPISPGLGM